MDDNIICLIETHLVGDNVININGFTWYGHNRGHKHFKAKRGSGGLGFLVQDKLFDDFHISIVDKCYEGIIALELKHKISEFSITVIGGYLPPENSVYGRNSTEFFSHLVALVYASIESDFIALCGDLNARVGKQLDYIVDVDDIPERVVLDTKTNNHGDMFIEFLKDMKMCIINGRLIPTNDNYTCLSTRGKSVVDYFAVPHECLRFCRSFSVTTVHDAIDKWKLQPLVSSKSRPPDHSIITCSVMYSYNLEEPLDRVATSESLPTGPNKDYKKCTVLTKYLGIL